MKKRVLVFLNHFFMCFLLISLSRVALADSNFGFSSEADKIDFIERVLVKNDLSEEDVKRFDQYSSFQEKVNSLPWSFTSDWYLFIRTALIGAQLAGMVGEEVFSFIVEGPRDFSDPMVIIEDFEKLVDLINLNGEIQSLFGTNPGQKIRLLEARYDSFTFLFKLFEVVKALSENVDTKSSLLIERAVMESVFYFAKAARDIAGLKMATGGQVVAYNLEALLAASLLELEDNYRDIFIQTWKSGFETIVKKEVSWFTPELRSIFKVEVETLLTDVKDLVSDEKFNRSVRSSTFSHKAGVLLLGVMQENFRTADLALEEIGKSEERLRSLGIEHKRLSQVLGPISYSANFSKNAIDTTALWTLGSLSAIEQASVSVVEYAASGVMSIGSAGTQAVAGIAGSGLAATSAVAGAAQSLSSFKLPGFKLPGFKKPESMSSSSLICSKILN